MTDQPDPTPRVRNRSDTRAAILAAARELLADEGFSGFGINALARRSGFDKQLVYRYFGGIEGLVDAIGESLSHWVSDNLADLADLPPAESYGVLVRRVILGYLAALRADPLMQKIVAWEISETSPHVRRLSDQRARSLGLWVMRMRGDLVPSPDSDAPALNAILLAAVQHLVLAGSAAGQFVGVPLASDADWDRIAAMVSRLIEAVHGPAAPDAH